MWVIKRSDGKYYKGGQGDASWRGDRGWKTGLHSATVYNKLCYLKPALHTAIEKLNYEYDRKNHSLNKIEPKYTCAAVEVEIVEKHDKRLI